MLNGKYRFNINEKGRLFVPAKMRESLGEKFMLSKSVRNEYLVIYTMEKWQSILEKLEQNSTATRNIRRRLFGNAVEMEADKQGRIIVPQELRESAGLTGDVIIIGTGDSAEIWNAENYAAYEATENEEEMEQKLIELGL